MIGALRVNLLDRIHIQTVRPRSDVAKRGIRSVFLQKFLYKIQLKFKYSPEAPETTNGLSQIRRMDTSTDQKEIKYSRLSLSRNRRDPQKQFEISVLRHIRFVVLRKKQFEQPNFTNDYVIRLL